MVWVKRNATTWDLYIDGESAGYVVKTTYKNGTVRYSGLAMYRKTRAVSKSVTGATLTPVKAAVARMARAQRR